MGKNLMANDPRDITGARFLKAIQLLGRNPGVRSQLVRFLQDCEAEIAHDGSIRDDITGPIVDQLHDDADIYEKTLADGTRFRFLFRTKIARDFLMAQEEHPSHVWEPQTTRVLMHLCSISSGDALIGGAYFGDQAVLAAKALSQRNHKVHCFEPNSAQFEMLVQNFNLNGLKNHACHSMGLWSTTDARLALEGFDSFANAVEASNPEDGFSTIKIDDYCTRNNVKLGIIQLDIEGAEYNALLGAQEILKRDRPNMIFEVHRDYVDWSVGLKNTPLFKLILGLGYKLYAIRDFNTHFEMGNAPIEIIPMDDVYLEGPPHGFNMLAVAEEGMLPAPLFKKVSHVSPKLLLHKDPALFHPTGGVPARMNRNSKHDRPG